MTDVPFSSYLSFSFSLFFFFFLNNFLSAFWVGMEWLETQNLILVVIASHTCITTRVYQQPK